MEKMDVDDDAVVDLSVSSVRRDNRKPTEGSHDLFRPLGPPLPPPPPPPPPTLSHREELSIGLIPRSIKDFDDRYPRRNLRPRQDRNYAESPDIIVLSDEEPRMNGFTNGFDSDSEGEMPPLPPIKELTPAEVEERERGLRKLREELRNEEMKLVLLKKLRQSQQMKENIAVVPPTPQGGVIPTPVGKPSGGSIGSVAAAAAAALAGSKLPPPPQQPPPPLIRANHKQPSGPGTVPPMLRGQPPPSRSQSLHHPPPLLLTPQAGRTSAPGLPSNILLAQQTHQRASAGPLPGRPSINTPPGVVLGGMSTKESHHSPSAPSLTQPLMGNVMDNKCSSHQPYASEPPPQERTRQIEDSQSPAQRQAAAKLALRKQLEKTLLQIPPPKPPPPEMHFIPNPSNTEFIYLLGLEHVVDYITKDQKAPPQPPDPFKCFQCHTDFTPVWKWERSSGKGSGKRDKEPIRISIYAGLDHVDHDGVSPGKDPKVICEQCVTSNVKKALKAEHTNRLKTAFVKALQQEQEIEQRLAQVGGGSSSNPVGVMGPGSVGCASPPDESPSAVSSAASTPTAPTPPAAPTPKPATPTQVPRHAAATPPLPPNATSKLPGSHHSAAAAAAAAAIHQQLLRGIPPHQPLPAHMLPFTPLLYPYQLAMAQAAGAKGMAAELQRQAADLQRQYLLDMIPSPAPSPSRAHPPHPGHPHSHAHAHAHSLNNWKT